MRWINYCQCTNMALIHMLVRYRVYHLYSCGSQDEQATEWREAIAILFSYSINYIALSSLFCSFILIYSIVFFSHNKFDSIH